jgi:hypothetical protein
VFHMDVAKVNRDVVYVAMVVHVSCKLFVPYGLVIFPNVFCKCVF